MQLCIDIGNSRVKTAVFKDDEEILVESMVNFDTGFHENLLASYPIENCIVSSTRADDENLNDFLSRHPETWILSHETPLPITVAYKTPHTLGKDRLAAAVACAALFPGENVVFIDAGTCITTNVIDSNARFLGGNISPGIRMRLKAMHHFTGRLPLAEFSYNEEFLGQNTHSALQNGAVKGAIYEVSSFLELSLELFPGARIVLTGGDAILFAKHLKFVIFANPNLVLLGLNKILKFNAEPKH